MGKKRILKKKQGNEQENKGGDDMAMALRSHNKYSTKDRLAELRERALRKKKRIGMNIPNESATKVANQNFKDLEDYIYSTMKE